MRGYKHLSPAQLADVLRVYEETLSVIATAEQVNVTDRQVRHALRRAGIPLSAAKGGACYQHIDELREWATDGVSLSEMARRIGTNHHRVSAFLKRNQIERKPFHQSGKNNPAWKGGRTQDKAGYVLIWLPTHPHANRHGYVREHRIVMENIIGRQLKRSEVVDHIDGNTSNNDPANLHLYASNAEHLAATLKGRTPDWTEETKDRQLEWLRQGREILQTASHSE